LDPDNDVIAVSSIGHKAYPAGKTTGIVSTMQANQPVYGGRIPALFVPTKTIS
jgi:hypothetical protein